MSRKNTPPSYTEPGGPRIVDTHSYKLSPLGPALKQYTMSYEVTFINYICGCQWRTLALEILPSI